MKNTDVIDAWKKVIEGDSEFEKRKSDTNKGGNTMSNTHKVIAKEDLSVDGHTWTKGLDYQVIYKDDYFILASNEGSLNYYNSVKGEVLALFSYKVEQ